jgi:hypothetical protein
MASRFDFHGLVIETVSSLPYDPARLLLAPLPTAPPGLPADLTISLGPAAADELVQRLPGPDAFVYAPNRLRIARDIVELAAPESLFTISGRRIDGLVSPPCLAGEGSADLVAQGPLLVALAVALRALGCYHLHAAALALPGLGTVLVPGPSGSGKSTLATALIGHGAHFLGDDTLFARRDGDQLRLLALSRDFHLSGQSAAALGISGPPSSARLTGAGKGRLDARTCFPGRFIAEAPAPSVILLPRITGMPTTRLEPEGPSVALGALLESSVLVATRGLPGGAGHLPLLAGLADGATTFRAELGLDLLSDPAATATLILSRLAS